jgi:hypothetical protein
MKKTIKKLIATMLSIAIVLTTFSSVSSAIKLDYDTTQINLSWQEKNEGIIYEEKFYDMEGDEINVIAEKQENEFIVKTYVNDQLVDSATREILSNGFLDDNIVYVKYYNESGKNSLDNIQIQDTKILNVNDYLDGETGESITDNSTSSRSASYPFIKSRYNSTWGHRGYLYGENVDTKTNNKNFYFGADTSVSIIVSTIVGGGVLFFTGFTVAGLAKAFGSSIVSSLLTTAITGYAVQTTEYWEYEVYVLGEYTLYGEINYVATNTYNNDGYLTGEFEDVEVGGPYEDENGLIDYGVYMYVITH